MNISTNSQVNIELNNQDDIRIPAEWEPHAACLMAWAVPPEWQDWTTRVKDDLAIVIRTISEFEPVWLLTPPECLADARARFQGCQVEIIEAPVADMWMRDSAPTFALRGQELVAIDWNPRDWGAAELRGGPTRGNAQGTVGSFSMVLSAILDIPRLQAPFVAEGGALITDGQGTLVTTRSCLLNPNRNPPCAGPSRQSRICEALRSFGISKVIWLEGEPCEPITSGHVDGYVLFTSPGRLLVESVEDEQVEPPMWRAHDTLILQQSLDAQGRNMQVERIRSPRKRHWKYRGDYWAPCYLNAYVANGAVITGCFGDRERDQAARESLQSAFPEHRVIMLRIDHIASGGGGIRCLTQPIPRGSSGISKGGY